MENDRQKLVQWLDRLEEYVRSEGLPTRIADRVQECKNSVRGGDADEPALRTEIEEVLNSIEKRKAADSVMTGRAEKAVTSEDIEKELRRMAQTCQRQNESVVADMAEREEILNTQNEAPKPAMKECICGAKVPAGQFMCLECGRKIE